MRLARLTRWVGLTLVVLVGLFALYFRFILDWEGQPVCHKCVMSACEMWMDEHHTNAFPNVNGNGSNSLAELHRYYPGVNLQTRYGYVAGLQKDDPPDLVLMYVNQPTRWIWHGPPQTVFAKKAWIVVPVDFAMPTLPQKARQPIKPGECSETLTDNEFRARLKRTIDFVRNNQRPNWETVVAEQTTFLTAMEKLQPSTRISTPDVPPVSTPDTATTSVHHRP